MRLVERFWTAVTYALELTTISPFGQNGIPQKPLFGNHDLQVSRPGHHHRKFKPPGGGNGSDFTCDYSNMGPDWRPCTKPTDRKCWLENQKTGERFDIHTNYENFAPKGIQRNYTLIVEDSTWNADGLPFNEAKLVNGTYPGPWLQACWGDTVQVIVINHMKHNGTTMHWHGIRQNQTMHMDGVPGITQCPIAPGDSFVYKWEAIQYGSSWYHSHYSLQYADGMAGPMTLHGPTSENFDEPAHSPVTLTDWGHNSAFDAIYGKVKNPSILLNGRGNITRFNGTTATLEIPTPFTLIFEPQARKPRYKKRPPAKKYLLCLINTSWDSTFIFSIDNHILTIAGADFVPILIVEAAPKLSGEDAPPPDGNFWIRTWTAANCFHNSEPGIEGYEKAGILRYDNTSTSFPKSKPWANISLACSDETYSSLAPVVKWQVGKASNGPHGEDSKVIDNFGPRPRPTPPFPLAHFAFSMPSHPKFMPLRINYSNPIFLKLNNTGTWEKSWVVLPENYSSADWVYLALSGTGPKGVTDSAHPIHLHGHDFAILEQVANKVYDPDNLNLKFDNPPRRDVALLPTNGYLVIAFKTDNPGSWLLHCHIAEHASNGLAFQIMERQQAANEIWSPYATSPAINAAERVCNNWDNWAANCSNWWDGDEKGAAGGCYRNATGWPYALQDDSGI